MTEHSSNKFPAIVAPLKCASLETFEFQCKQNRIEITARIEAAKKTALRERFCYFRITGSPEVVKQISGELVGVFKVFQYTPLYLDSFVVEVFYKGWQDVPQGGVNVNSIFRVNLIEIAGESKKESSCVTQ